MQKLPAAVQHRIPNARMPLNYVVAKNAVSKCVKIDECKEWSDKTMALASYARQVKDRELEQNAKRLRLRAQVRMGELLRELDAPHGGWQDPDGKIRNRRGMSQRYQTGLDAGLSRAMINRTVSMARVPEEKREEVIEATPPISPRALSDLGRVRKFKTGREVGAAYKELVSASWGANLGKFHAWIKGKSATFIGSQITAKDEVDRLRKLITDCQEWLDELDQALHNED